MADDLPGVGLCVVCVDIVSHLVAYKSCPPTASSCPFTVMQVEYFTGRLPIMCHTWWFLSSGKSLSLLFQVIEEENSESR